MQTQTGVVCYHALRYVSDTTRVRVIRWLDYIWNERHCSTAVDDKVLEVLPNSLRVEIAVQVHGESLKQINIFRGCDPVSVAY